MDQKREINIYDVEEAFRECSDSFTQVASIMNFNTPVLETAKAIQQLGATLSRCGIVLENYVKFIEEKQ